MLLIWVYFKECGVCGERFEEYWDEEGDAWKLKECTLGADGRVRLSSTSRLSYAL